jgi:hypothetical protein
MVVVTVCIIPDGQDFDYSNVEGGILAVLSLNGGVSTHVVGTYQPNVSTICAELSAQITAWAHRYPNSVVLVQGERSNGARFLMPLSVRALLSS